MKYYTHMLFGMILAFFAYFVMLYLDLIGEFDMLFAICLVIIYSILPDIDIRKSKIRRFVMPILIFLVLLMYYIQNFLVMLSLLVLIAFIYMLKHRTFTHTIFFAVLVSLPLQNLVYIILGFVAYLSHLILDRHVKMI